MRWFYLATTKKAPFKIERSFLESSKLIFQRFLNLERFTDYEQALEKIDSSNLSPKEKVELGNRYIKKAEEISGMNDTKRSGLIGNKGLTDIDEKRYLTVEKYADEEIKKVLEDGISIENLDKALSIIALYPQQRDGGWGGENQTPEQNVMGKEKWEKYEKQLIRINNYLESIIENYELGENATDQQIINLMEKGKRINDLVSDAGLSLGKSWSMNGYFHKVLHDASFEQRNIGKQVRFTTIYDLENIGVYSFIDEYGNEDGWGEKEEFGKSVNIKTKQVHGIDTERKNIGETIRIANLINYAKNYTQDKKAGDEEPFYSEGGGKLSFDIDRDMNNAIIVRKLQASKNYKSLKDPEKMKAVLNYLNNRWKQHNAEKGNTSS